LSFFFQKIARYGLVFAASSQTSQLMIKDGMNPQLKDLSEAKQQELEPIDSGSLVKNTQVPEKASKDTLSLYERRQLLLGTIQASIVAIGTGAAIYVGVKQAAINQQL
jgi:hypothetical protein